jgi:isopentenyldiphosphate isomerase
MAFLDRIRACNNHDPTGYRPFRVAGQTVGSIGPAFAERLARDGAGVFHVTEDAVTLDPALGGPDTRSAAVDGVLRELAADGVITGWRDEPYPVAPLGAMPPVADPLLQMERAAVPLFGIRAFGVHMSGFVRRPDGLHLWVARRAADKETYPGMLDNTVAGGQPVGIGLRDNLVKECAEEAGIPADIAGRAIPVGVIAYVYREPGPGGFDLLKPDVQFCYDLELPADFAPRNTDGEIDEFFLWPIERAAATVRDTADFKFNCNLVIIDFLLRHGVITPETEPDYLRLCQGLHGAAADLEGVAARRRWESRGPSGRPTPVR